MFLKPRTTSPRTVRRAGSAKAGKPRAKKLTASTPISKPRHTSPKKAARKGAGAKPLKAAQQSQPASLQLNVIQISTHKLFPRKMLV
jgi:hypothetical protein